MQGYPGGTEVSGAVSAGIRGAPVDGLEWLGDDGSRATIAQSLSASQVCVSSLRAERFSRFSNLLALTNPVKFRELNRLMFLIGFLRLKKIDIII